MEIQLLETKELSKHVRDKAVERHKLLLGYTKILKTSNTAPSTIKS